MPRSISCEVVTLGRLISTTDSFLVPPFQRNYAWGEKQYSAFWDDLARTFDDAGNEIFIGASVFRPSSSASGARQLTVIDGQQRLTTAAILLSALRHHLRARNLHELAARIEDEFLRGVDPGTGQPGARFNLNVANKNTFDDHIYKLSEIRVVHEQKKGKRSSNTNALLLSCFMFMHKKIGLARRLYGCTLEELAAKVLRSLNDRVTLIHISVADDLNAFALFETLNERGLELSQFDIMKNYLLTLARPNAARALATWVTVENNLRSASVSAFLRQHWVSRGKIIEEKHLFEELKRAVTDGRDAMLYLESLERSSAHYAALHDPEYAYWRKLPDQAQRDVLGSVRAFRSLGATQPLVMLLAALETLDAAPEKAAEFAQLMRLLVSFTVRYTTICSLPPSRLAANYAKAAAFIRREQDLQPEAIFVKFLAPLYPDDETFVAAFRNKQSQDNAICRYLIASINDSMSIASREPSLAPELTSIDHILPQNPSVVWLQVRRQFRDGFRGYIYRLGNMTLMAPGENQKIGNAGFDEKRTVYSQDALEITRLVAKSEKWTPKEIDQRQKWMAAAAVQIWRCP
ncbi:MAG: DUF262 domain-containing protein [Chitinophagales bacterium]|nr:DUF262 domain-containing protein [Hyphomicrobiales bacterium]